MVVKICSLLLLLLAIVSVTADGEWSYLKRSEVTRKVHIIIAIKQVCIFFLLSTIFFLVVKFVIFIHLSSVC